MSEDDGKKKKKKGFFAKAFGLKSKEEKLAEAAALKAEQAAEVDRQMAERMAAINAAALKSAREMDEAAGDGPSEAEKARLEAEERKKAEEQAKKDVEAAKKLAEEKRLAAEKAKAEAEAKAKAAEEKAKAAEAKRIADEKAAAEKAEKERIAAEKEAARLKAEKEEAQKAEKERLAAEAERIKAEKAAAAQAEKERIKAEKEAAKQRAREEKEAAKQKAREEKERLKADKAAIAKAKKEQSKAEAEALKAKLAEERQARLLAEKEAAEKAKAERVEAERLAAEQAKAEAERLAAEKAEAERLAAERRAQEEKDAAERAAQDAQEKAAADAARAEQEKLAREQAEIAKAEADKLATEEAEAAKAAIEQAEAEQLEAERIEKEAAEKAEAERVAAEAAQAAAEKAEAEAPAVDPDAPKKKGFFSRITEGLRKSSSRVSESVTTLFNKRKLDAEALEELEDLLIASDLGVAPAMRVTEMLAKDKFDKQVTAMEIKIALADVIAETLKPLEKPLVLGDGNPEIVLFVGVNGSGKTTTLGKIAKRYTDKGKKVLIAAGDTFRAAAVEQLKVWGERSNAPVISANLGADAAGLVYDAIAKAKAENFDILMIDTAGRLQNRTELMDELSKIVRVIKKQDENAPHHAILVLDATVGQNALSQTEAFKETAGITGLIMTKLDGTAKGGVLVALADKFKLPIHSIGIGERIEDLENFSADVFAAALSGVADAVIDEVNS